MSTPAPPGTPLESRNYVDAPRPFKNPGYTRNANRRTRTLKQILAAERDAAIGSDGGVGSGKRKGRKSMLSGLNGNGASAGASTQASRAGTDELPDGDTTMASVGDVAGANVDEAMIAAARRKRELPTCE